MRITDIKVFPVREEKLKAFVSIILDDCFMVNDIKVIKGNDGFFISMPSRRKRSGKFKDIAHPLNNETRQAMEQEILAAYEASPASAPSVDSENNDRPADGPRPRRQRRRKPRRRSASGSREPRESRPDESERAASGEASAQRDRSEESGRPSADAPPPSRPERASSPATESSDASADAGGKSADEVAEHHLRDSFWGT